MSDRVLIRRPSPIPFTHARSLVSVEDAARLYGEWASTYDADVFGKLGFTGSARIAELLAHFLPDPDQPVVDLGCGTGAVGRRLAQLSVARIDGIDLSPEMLAVAASTGAYRNLTVGDLNALPADLDTTYAASVSAGTFTTGHVGPDAVPSLMQLLRPAGLVAWVIALTWWPRFEPVLASTRRKCCTRRSSRSDAMARPRRSCSSPEHPRPVDDVDREIVGFRQDEIGDWVAELDCHHRQHVRHRPPLWPRAWVETSAGRARHVGTTLDCPLCDRRNSRTGSSWLAPQGRSTNRRCPLGCDGTTELPLARRASVRDRRVRSPHDADGATPRP